MRRILMHPVAAALLAVALVGSTSARAGAQGTVAAAPAAPAATPAAAEADGPKVGDLAPDFALPYATKDGVGQGTLKLSSLRGRTVVLAFYPRARTRGCTAQMEAYKERYPALFNGGDGVTVLAISTDADTTVHNWAREREYPVTFVSDTAGTLADAYDVRYPAVNMYRRVLFVVGPDGRVTHIMRPFRELAEDSYTELSDAVKSARAARGN